ncbi:MAG: ABC transporter permease, partial [Chloroflexota bacterium]|nr:ABC transporter permease [Chloroflexota bacterium]
LLALLTRTVQMGALLPALRNPIVLAALQLSLLTAGASLALALLLGTPLAYALARVPFPGRGVVEALVEVPIVLPPAVAGIALLMAFGRRGILGAPMAEAGISLAFTTWAVILAQCFVAIPFYIRSAKAGFQGVDQDLEQTAYTLGESPLGTFWRVTVPLAFPSLLAGAVLCWARALGEFGATIMFAGSFRGRTQTMPLAIYGALESDLGAALALGTILVFVSVAALGLLRLVTRRQAGAAAPPATSSEIPGPQGSQAAPRAVSHPGGQAGMPLGLGEDARR